MGYIKHHTIIVTSWERTKIIKAHEKAKEIFASYENGAEKIVSKPLKYLMNLGYSFFIAPDGSKEGWDTSNNMDKAREEFLDWMDKNVPYCDYVEITFGGDDERTEILRTNKQIEEE